MEAGKYAEAKPTAERIVQMARKLAGSENAEVAIGLRNLAWICEETADPRAGGLYEEAVAICEAALGADHERTIRYRNEWEEYAKKRPASPPALEQSQIPETSIALLKTVAEFLSDMEGQPVKLKCGIDMAMAANGTVSAMVETSHREDAFFVMKNGDGWQARLWHKPQINLADWDQLMGLMSKQPQAIWESGDSAIPNAEGMRGIIRFFLPEFEADPLTIIGRKQQGCESPETSILRNIFSTKGGRVTLHSRRASGGTQLVLEVNNLSESKFLNVFHDAATSEMKCVGHLNQVPF
jgi:hypothetical protein